MSNATISRINSMSFVTSLFSILMGTLIAILGIWEVIDTNTGLWKGLSSCLAVFTAAVLCNLAIACYKKPGGLA